MRDLLKLMLFVPAYAFARAVALLFAGVRLVLAMAPVLAIGIWLSGRPGYSQQTQDLIAITSGWVALGFLVWLMAAKPPKNGAQPSLRYRYAKLMGVEQVRKKAA